MRFSRHSKRTVLVVRANAVDMICMVYESWCGAKVKTTRQRKGAGGKVIVYKMEHEALPLWPLITTRNDEEMFS